MPLDQEPAVEELRLTVDNRRLLCAQGLLQVMKHLTDLKPGQVMLILSSDSSAKREYQAFAQRAGHEFMGTFIEGSLLRKVYKTYLRKGAKERFHSVWPRGSSESCRATPETGND